MEKLPSRASNFKEGVISAQLAAVRYKPDLEGIVDFQWAVHTSAERFSAPGDSGAAVVSSDDTGICLVGMVVGGAAVARGDSIFLQDLSHV